MIPLELTSPLPLWALAIAVPVLAWFFVRGLTDFERWQRIFSLVIRSAVVVLLILALCGPKWRQPTREQFVVFAVDESASVGADGRKAAQDFLDLATPLAGSNRVAFLTFGAEPGLVDAERGRSTITPEQQRGTNLAAALEVAAAAIPPSYVPHVVLLSDGNQTAGDALKAALRGGVPISTVPLPSKSEPEVQVAALNAPAQVREGEPFFVEVVLDANTDDAGEIEIFRKGIKVPIAQPGVTVKKGANRFRFPQALPQGKGLTPYEVRLKGFKHQSPDRASGNALVYTSGKPRVLIVESDVKQARELASALEQEGILVEVRPPRGLPDRLSELQNFELVILSNVPATALTQRQMQAARRYVQDLGGGLIMLGGDQSFGLGGYYKTELEEILPVRSDFEKEKEKPSLAMIIIIDKSGSMGGQKIELAKDAAKGAVELLGNADKIGVIAFEGDVFWVADVQSAANKGSVIDKISGIEAGGGTVMYPAMEAAYDALKQTTAKLKHVIILTDGVSEPGDFEGVTQQMQADRITVTTVGVASGPDDIDRKLLERIAEVGRGRFYYTEDPASIPQIFAKETVTASKSAIQEQPFAPQVLRPTPVLAEVDLASAPFLLGYVTTRPKPTSEVILVSERGDPVLSWWRYGLGMTAAFTSDAKGRWAAEWLSWPGFSKFWAQVARHTMRKSESKGVAMTVETKDGKATVTLDAVDVQGEYVNKAEPTLMLVDSPGQADEKAITFAQTAPGRYVGEFPTPAKGEYHFRAALKRDGQNVAELTRGLTVGLDDEFRLKPTDEEMLKKLAEVSGGKFKPTPAEVFAPPSGTAERPSELWPYLLMAALALFLADVAMRRIDFALVLGRKPAFARAG